MAATTHPTEPYSDERLLDLPLREFVTTPEAAELLGIAYKSMHATLRNPKLRKVKLTEKCWLVLRRSAEELKATRHSPGRPRRKRRAKI